MTPLTDADHPTSELSASILTCSFRGDFDSCRLMCESVDQFVPEGIQHKLFVPTADLELFAELETPRRSIVSEDTLLPAWMRKLPLPSQKWRRLLGLPRRNIYLTPYSKPVRGWIAQQMMKIAASMAATTDIVLHVDSDNVFIRPLSIESLGRDRQQVRLYQTPDHQMGEEGHRTWHLTASRLFGLPPDEFHSGDYIDSLVVWRPDVVRKMTDHIARLGGRDWRIVLAREPHFSEYILYGVFADRVLGLEAAGLEAQTFTLCHSRWSGDLESEAAATTFVESVRPEHVVCLIQSTIPLPLEERRRIFRRVTEFAAHQQG